MNIRFDRVTKTFPGACSPAVSDFTLDVEARSFVALLGPSGCGKSTTLRMVAGLERPSAGRISIGDRDVTGLPPERRGVAMVFQNYALFPHLDVRDNILFGLQIRRVPRPERQARLDEAVALLGLSGLLDRRPSQLSGGQQQRVALGRAVVARHPVLLMDEPLSNLDAMLRQEMRAELRALQRKLGLTVIFVTHDQAEAMSMADRIVLMNAGRIEQADAPPVLYSRPATAFAARFVGTPPMNLLPLQALVARPRAVEPQDPGAATLGLRPECIRLDARGLPATVESLDYLGADTLVHCRMGELRLLVRVPGAEAPAPGASLGLRWHAADAHYFDAAGRRVDPPPIAVPLEKGVCR